jgi:hypothetical protein
MLFLFSKFSDFVAVKEALGNPKLFLYYYVASPEQVKMCAIYDGGIAFRTNSLTGSGIPNPSTILAEFPEAVQVDHIELVTI